MVRVDAGADDEAEAVAELAPADCGVRAADTGRKPPTPTSRAPVLTPPTANPITVATATIDQRGLPVIGNPARPGSWRHHADEAAR